ncbi:MAG: hypothetical protein IPO21_01355 [Bacteroidales bacterium]|nr:hypothetical protein [Bacteroidales bacterium]
MELEVISKTGKAQCLDYQLYNFLSDFNNIAQILPPEHRDKMECTADTCTINAQAGMSVTLEFIERDPYKMLKLGAVMGKDFYIWIQLKQVDAYDTRVRMTIKLK